MRDEDLLARFKQKYKGQDTRGFNFFDLLHVKGSPLDALFYSRLFLPEFIEIDGMVFLKETIEDDDDRKRLNDALERYGNDRVRVEQSFNLVEVPSLFGKNTSETSDEEDLLLAERLAEMWRYKLKLVYPDRQFSVRVLSPKETGGEVGVIFHTAG